MSKKCAWPNCNKTLPEDLKIPLCDYHRGEVKDKGSKIGAGVLTTAGSVALFVKNNGPELVKKGAVVAKHVILKR